MKIWSLRHTADKGTHMKQERECSENDARAWLSVFREDEPKIIFIASNTKPSAKA